MLKETQELYSDSILHQALKLFGGTIEKCKDLGGFEAFVYELETDNRFYIMKITHTIRRSVNYIMGELEFVNYLAEHGVPTSHAVQSQNGKFVETIDASDGSQFLVYLFEKAIGRGSKFEDWTDDLISTWGQVSGMMTRLSKDYKPSNDAYKRQQWYTDDIYNFDKYIPASKQKTIQNCKNIIEKVKSYPTDKNSFGLIHGDLHQGNFFINNGTITPFDFDDCEYSFFINDIAIPLFYTSPKNYVDQNYGMTKEEFGENFLLQFLKGYRKENHVDKEWILKIPDFLQIRSIILYVILNQVWVGDTLNENRASIIERLRSFIDGEKKMLDIDYSKFI